MTVESYRPRCYFDIEIDHEQAGRVTIELFTDVCPKTCENFLALCTGDRGHGKTTKKHLCYKGTPFHRIIKNFMIQSGDFECGNGTGGESIFGGQFTDENFLMKHDKPFLLSMANKGRNTNGSQFFITTQPTPHLDGKHTVFGHVISGHEVVSEIENLRTDQNSKPVKEVVIAQCGELVPKSDKKRRKKETSSERGSSSEEERRKKKKKKKHSKKHKHEKKDSKSHGASEDNEEDEGMCSIDPGEIPDIPANNFLWRNTSPVQDFRRNPRQRDSFNYRRAPSRSRSGRKIKGRGNRRYRTPVSSDERSGSETPPHWKMASSRLKNLKDVIPKKNDQESEDDLTPDEDLESDAGNPVLQSRLGMTSKRGDARMNIDDNRRREQEQSPRPDHRGSDLFKKLLDEEKKHGGRWYQDSESRHRDGNHTSPLRSKIVVKSSIASRGREEDVHLADERSDYRKSDYRERRSRRDMFSDKRPYSSHVDSGSEQDNRRRRESGEWHSTDTNTKKNSRAEKPKPSAKDLKRLNVLETDLFRYTKKNPKKIEEADPSKLEKQNQPDGKKQDMPVVSKKQAIQLENDLFRYTKKNPKKDVKKPENSDLVKQKLANVAEKAILQENSSHNESINNNSSLSMSFQALEMQKIPFLEEAVISEPKSPVEDPGPSNVSETEEMDTQETHTEYSSSTVVADSHHSSYSFGQMKDVPIPMLQDELGINNLNSNNNVISKPEASVATSDDEDAPQGSPSCNVPVPDIIPLPEEVVDVQEASIAALEDRRREIMARLIDSEDVQQVDEESTSVAYKKENRNELPELRKSKDRTPEASKRATSHSSKSRSPSKEASKGTSKRHDRASRSPSDNKPSSSRRSRSPINRHSKSSPRRNKSPSSRQRSTNDRRSRSRSRHRSTSRNRAARKYSRSPDFRQRRSRSQPRNSDRGVRSHRYSGVRNRTPDRRGSYQRRYGRGSPYRGRARGRSTSRRSNTRSRSRSVDKRRRRRHQSSSSRSSSSSSSHSEKNRKKKNTGKGKKKKSSSSSSSSSRSKRSNSHST